MKANTVTIERVESEPIVEWEIVPGEIDDCLYSTESTQLGKIIDRPDIKTTLPPFKLLPDYKVEYPQVVVDALGELLAEYNSAFCSLIAANKEWETDYQYCMQDGQPINYGVQIDLIGLSPELLSKLSEMRVEMVREILRLKIFEIENSLAMYQLLSEGFSTAVSPSLFKREFRKMLECLRQKFKKKIVLLAITNEKYDAMKAIEFGKSPHEEITSEEVQSLSGFDALMGPSEFLAHLEENNGKSKHLLFVRASEPVAKLRKPGLEVESPLVAKESVRKAIKAAAVTMNVDGPEMDSKQRINDTKEYMQAMRMAFPIETEADLYSPEYMKYLAAGKPYKDYPGDTRLSVAFSEYLCSRGTDPKSVESGEVMLRAKPMKGAYGCYGHSSGSLSEGKFRKELRKNLRERGSYVIQLEMRTPEITNTTTGDEYAYIDRVFLSADGNNARFMGGFRILMPTDSVEAKKRRMHGAIAAIFAEIN